MNKPTLPHLTPKPKTPKHGGGGVGTFGRGLLTIALLPVVFFSGCVGAVSFVIEKNQNAHLQGQPTAVATVIDVRTEPYPSISIDEDGTRNKTNTPRDMVMLNFTTHDGRGVSVRMVQQSPTIFAKGDKVPISYNALSPSNIQLTSEQSQSFLKKLYQIAGAVFVAALGLLTFARGQKGDKDKMDPNGPQGR